MKPDLFRQLGSLLVTYRARYLVALLTVLASNLLLVGNPLLFRYAVNLYDSGTSISVYYWGGLLLAVATLTALFKYRMRVAFVAISREAEVDIRSALLDRLQSQAQAFYTRHRVGALMSRMVNDVSVYRDVIGPGILYPANFITLVIPALVALFVLSPSMAWLSLVPIAALPLCMYALRGVLYRYSKRVQESLADLSTLSQESYSGIRLLKCYGVEPSFSARFSGLSHEFYRASLRLLAAENLLYPFLRLLGKVTTIGLTWLAGYLILVRQTGLSTADFVSFMWIQSYVLLPVMMLGWIIPQYQRGRGAYARIYDLYNEPREVDEGGDERLSVGAAVAVKFERVGFTYPEAPTPALIEVTASIKAGSICGITGPPGSGKSTLFSLLTRDYSCVEGSISIDGHPLHEFSLSNLRSHTAVVEQDPFLFSRSIRDNIALGRAEAGQEEIELVARMAQVHETILSFPDGYDTLIGERGVTLSGGQKQRIAIARALLVGAPILLLDDVFSALDAATAMQLFETLCKLEGVTIMLITHKVALLKKCDNLLFFSHGKVVEQGSPADPGPHFSALIDLDRMHHD